jgi:hypothetical protein
MKLRPVTFGYQKAFADGIKTDAIRFSVLDSMSLNEVQRQQEKIGSLEERLAKMEAALASAAQVQNKRQAKWIADTTKPGWLTRLSLWNWFGGRV